MDAPARASKASAQKDRDFVAATVRCHPRSCGLEVCLDAITHLRNGGHASAVPGSASIADTIEVEKLTCLRKVELREFAKQTPGVVRYKKNENGQWILKTCAELQKDVVQALSGCRTSPKGRSPRVLRRPATTQH